LNSAHEQRRAYNEATTPKDPQSAVITIDFKQNLVLPMLQETPSRYFYQNEQISVLGIVVNFFDGTAVRENLVVYLSESLNHDFFYVQTCLTDVLQMPFLKDVKTLYLFSDNAQVFRSAAYFNFVLKECGSIGGTRTIYLNYFNQHHGKSACDRYFGLLSKHLLTTSLSSDITSFAELFRTVREWQPLEPASQTHEYLADMLRFILFSLL
jgi:hypothetical protein